jgi:predicted phosphodiesterase
MRLAVISDIHGNCDALKQVLADIDASDIDDTICLGDNIGYGPEPNEVIELLQERNIPSVVGNHELGVINPKFLSWFNQPARQSLEWTIRSLTENSLTFIHNLNNFILAHTCRFVHGTPPNSPVTYLFQLSHFKLKQVFERTSQRLCFVGHTHVLELITSGAKGVERAPLLESPVQLNEGKKYIINVGAVGQPRDGNNNAKYVIWDDADDSLEVRFVPYDIAAVVEKMLQAGLPEAHVLRLW